MKYLFIFSVFLVSSLCVSNTTFGQFNKYPTNKKLVQIPTIRHNQSVKVFYLDEKPDTPYVKIALLEAYRGASDSYANILQDLQLQAQGEGVDAIMIFKFQTGMRSYRDSEGYMTSYAVKEILAYGIKYVSNFDYLSFIPKIESIYLYNDSTMAFDKAYYRQFNLFGKFVDFNCSSDFNNFLYQYSLYHLVQEQENWTYAVQGNLISERNFKTNSNEKKCKFHYDSLQRLSVINIETHQEKIDAYTVTYKQQVSLSYNENGLLHQKDIYPNPMNKTAFYREIFRYDRFGRLEEKLLFIYSNGERTPMAKCFYTEFYNWETVKMMFPELR
jgi:hypothetical protein